MTREEEIKNYMDKLNISYEEAEALWEDDKEDYIGEDGEEMQAKAKKNCKHCEQSNKKRKKAEKERKVDVLKGQILTSLKPTIEQYGTITFQKTETEIDFIIDEIPYTLKLTKHKKGWTRK